MVILTMRVVDRSESAWVGELARRTTAELGMTDKEAAILQGYPITDGSQWHKAMKGEAPMDLLRMVRLPIRWWQGFLPKLASALITRHYDDLFGPLRMARAEVDSHDERKRA